MKELIEQIAKALVDSPDEVSVQAVEGEEMYIGRPGDTLGQIAAMIYGDSSK